MVSIEFTVHALKDLQELDTGVSRRIIEKIYWLQQNFNSILRERLHYDRRKEYKLRVGDYRAVYSIDNNVVTIETVRHRRDVYK